MYSKGISDSQLRQLLAEAPIANHRLWPHVDRESSRIALFNSLTANKEIRIFFFDKDQNDVAMLVFEHLSWDSDHFGQKSGRVVYIQDGGLSAAEGTNQNKLPVILDQFLDYLNDEEYKFVSADVGSLESSSSLALQNTGFRYILSWTDGFITDPIDFPTLPGHLEIGEVQASEIPTLSRIAANDYYKGGRFYLDNQFDPNVVDQMYAKLVESSFETGQHMQVARWKGEPVGLFICKKVQTYDSYSGLRVAPLRFLVIDRKYRNMKIAQHLFLYMLAYARQRSDLVSTGLESHNIASMNLHAKLGFRFNHSHSIYHWHSLSK